MKLAKDQFDAAVKEYAAAELFPVMGNNWKTWLLAGALPVMMPQVHEMLTRFGLEEDNAVDIEKMGKFMISAFTAQPKVEVFGITFLASDGQKFLEHLKHKNKAL